MHTHHKNIMTAMIMFIDVVMVIFSFIFAYYYRIHFDGRPFYFQPDTQSFIILAFTLIPLWLSVNLLSGLYDRSVFLVRSREYSRILIASIVSVMMMISYEFFTDEDIFPAKIIAIYFIGINFIMLVSGRIVIRFISKYLIQKGIGRRKTILVGNDNTKILELARFFTKHIAYGYDIVGLVGKNIVTDDFTCFTKFINAADMMRPDVIIQVDTDKSQEVYHYAAQHHLVYMFTPQQDRMMSPLHKIEIINGTPVIEVQQTPLMGLGQFWKRLMDITLGGLALIIFSPIMLFIAFIMKITSPKESVFYKQIRLSRFNRQVGIYKFRSMKTKYSGMTPEEAFEKMGRPELSIQYRENGDQLDNDPRITRLGAFLRSTSLDELPQLLNVIKGDISLVGPRALIPQEINQAKRKHVILSVRSGLTGLAQVSGRRDISFEERRRLDVYYVQNWSIWLDIQILFRTVTMVLFRRGAK